MKKDPGVFRSDHWVIFQNYIKNKRIGYIADHQFPLDRSDAGAEQVIYTISALAAEGLNIELIIPKRWKNIGLSSDTRKKRLQEYYEVASNFALTELLHLPPSRAANVKVKNKHVNQWL